MNVKFCEIWRKMEILSTWYSEVHVLVHREFLSASVFRAWESGVLCTQKEHIRTTSSTFSMCSQLELCRGIDSNSHMIRNILFTDKAHSTSDVVNNTRNSRFWGRHNPNGTVESNYQHRFSLNVLCICHWWPTHWPVHFHVTSDSWYLHQLFAIWTAQQY
jgi:hypothetical protein